MCSKYRYQHQKDVVGFSRRLLAYSEHQSMTIGVNFERLIGNWGIVFHSNVFGKKRRNKKKKFQNKHTHTHTHTLLSIVDPVSRRIDR